MKKKPHKVTVTASELRKKWGEISNSAFRGNHIFVTTHDRVTHVMVSYEQYTEMKDGRNV